MVLLVIIGRCGLLRVSYVSFLLEGDGWVDNYYEKTIFLVKSEGIKKWLAFFFDLEISKLNF